MSNTINSLSTLRDRLLEALGGESLNSSDWVYVTDSTRRITKFTDAAAWVSANQLHALGDDEAIIAELYAMAGDGLVTIRPSRSKSSEWLSLHDEGKEKRK